ncbi:hypothetical protein [Streptomyces sp. FH025]|uniref:hypothetical protein n=1 Tax=Streptomyces sp. FH025 TaxID=2815937 RepID=UPI001A9E43BE|nr:hypothetical protein [Streptomyces sp. FH025]MBO1416197.1 hypothetical protein [Streptomyces sp. FH025]
MTAEALLALLRRHWDDVAAALDERHREVLLARLDALAGLQGGDEMAVKRALHGVKLALLPLPLDHPVRRALDGVRLVAADPRPAAGAARELLDWLSASTAQSVEQPVEQSDRQPDERPDEQAGTREADALVAEAQRRLLAAPALSDAQLDSLRVPDAGLIRLLDTEGEPRFPAFQFAADGSPLPVVTRINALLLADQDPWGAADWWLGGNSWLGGTPARLLGLVSDDLLTAAAVALTEGD